MGHFAFFYMDMTTTEKNTIIEMLAPMLELDGIELVDVEAHRQTLRLLIHKPEGLSVADCQAVNHVVHPILEIHEQLTDYIQLEVASPGIDRPLQTARDFQRNSGRTVQIEVASESENGQERHVQGVIIEVHPERVILAQAGGENLSIQISQIRKAHIHLKW
ncbi:hypothetical protein C6499_08570 [Candidatus Poribacteria bacterium]|nr:MAG: hypothetical protein C6499_08570 [Candidatus Poribacteria bacterium]